MEKNQTGKAFGMQGGPANGERTTEKMTYEKARMEIIYFDGDVFAGSVLPSPATGGGDDEGPAGGGSGSSSGGSGSFG